MIAQLSETEKKAILKTLDGLPPLEYLLLCTTPDQANHWIDLKRGYDWLKQAFADLFEGKAVQHSDLSKKERLYYRQLRSYYLEFHLVVQWGWQEIESYCNRRGVSLSEMGINSPSEALTQVLENDCAATMASCFQPWLRWTPSQDRNLHKLDRKIKASTNGITKELESQRRALEAKSGNWADDYLFPRRILIAICRASKDESLREQVESFDQAAIELSQSHQSRIHEGEGISGFEWLRGERKILQPRGGIAI